MNQTVDDYLSLSRNMENLTLSQTLSLSCILELRDWDLLEELILLYGEDENKDYHESND